MPSMVTFQARQVAPMLSSEDSPDESVGEADYSHALPCIHSDCWQDEAIDLCAPRLDENAAQQIVTMLRSKQTTVAPLSLRLARTQVPAASLLDILAALGETASARLQSLELSDNELGDDAAGVLAALVRVPTLKSLNLSGNRLTDSGVAAVLTALRSSGATLTRLVLSHCRLGATSSALLGELVGGPWADTLEELTVAHCGLDAATASAVVEGAHRARTLRHLDLSGNDCGLSLASPLTPRRPVSLPPSLEVLNLSDNLIKPLLIRGFGAALATCCSSLVELRLAGCLEGDDSLYTLFAILRDIPRLRVLDLSRCRLTYRSGKLLAQKLVFFRTLERVFLNDNPLDVEGAGDLSSGLERSKSLHTLSLSSCRIGNCGAAAVVNSLVRGAAPLRRLDLSDNYINDAGVRDLCTLLSKETSPALDMLALCRNACTLQSRVQLSEMMRDRQHGCLVLARGTPLEELASLGSSSGGSATRNASESSSFAE